MSTAAIWRIVLIRSRMLSAVAATNVSAQSPPWSTNASPRAADAIRSRSRSHSPAKTRGGYADSVSTAVRTAPASGHDGCWPATREAAEASSSAWSSALSFTITPRF